jgi:hypothetical protein
MANIGFRGVFTLFFDGMISAMNPYPKPWKIRVRRILNGWDGAVFEPSYAKVVMTSSVAATDYPQADTTIHAMNAVHIIYECLTNRVWGRGLDRNRLGPSWNAAAQYAYSEGFGLCLRWTRQSEIDEFVKGVVNTLGASIYTDKTTGKIEIKLIRGDYAFEDLPVFDASTGLLEISEATVVAPSTQTTECIVTYKDPITDKPRKVRSQNLGAIHGNSGGVNTLARSYEGVPTPELALRLAQRDLRAASSRLRRFSITLDRRGWNINPGDVIRVRDPFRKIPDTAVRIAKVDDGTLADGRIRLQGMQDVFALPATSYTGAEPNRWRPPSSDPCTGRHRAFELPYFMLVQSLSAADLSALTGDGAMVGLVMEEGKDLNNSFDVVLKTGSPTVDEVPTSDVYYCPTWTPPQIAIPPAITTLTNWNLSGSVFSTTGPLQVGIDDESMGSFDNAALATYSATLPAPFTSGYALYSVLSGVGLSVSPAFITPGYGPVSVAVDSGKLTVEFHLSVSGSAESVSVEVNIALGDSNSIGLVVFGATSSGAFQVKAFTSTATGGSEIVFGTVTGSDLKHYAFTIEQNLLTCWVNGVRLGSAATNETGLVSDITGFYLDAYNTGSGPNRQAVLGSFRITDGARYSGESFTPPTGPLT